MPTRVELAKNKPAKLPIRPLLIKSFETHEILVSKLVSF